MRKIIGYVLIVLSVVGMAVVCAITGSAVGEKTANTITKIKEEFID